MGVERLGKFLIQSNFILTSFEMISQTFLLQKLFFFRLLTFLENLLSSLLASFLPALLLACLTASLPAPFALLSRLNLQLSSRFSSSFFLYPTSSHTSKFLSFSLLHRHQDLFPRIEFQINISSLSLPLFFPTFSSFSLKFHPVSF